MSRRYLILNILLCFVILLLSFESYTTWNHTWRPSAGIVSEISDAKKENPAMGTSTKELEPVNSYNLISEQNIFSPERKDFPTAANVVEAQSPRPIVHPQIILYGVAITDDYASAIVANPGRALRNGDREIMTVKEGANIGGYRLAKILPDRISLENNGDAFQVLLDDFRYRKKRMEVKTDIKLTAATSLQPTSSPSGEATAQEAKEPVRAQAPLPLPFNKYTYQLYLSSATAKGRKG